MRFYILIGALGALVACSGPRTGKVQFGVTTAAQLKEARGEPVSQQAVTAEHPSQVLIYPQDEKFQVEKDIVVAGFRNPTLAEQSLLYWRHRFQGKETTFTSLDQHTEHSHGASEMQLRCPSEGLTIVYDSNRDIVTRVVEHAQQSN